MMHSDLAVDTMQRLGLNHPSGRCLTQELCGQFSSQAAAHSWIDLGKPAEGHQGAEEGKESQLQGGATRERQLVQHYSK